jgi:NhaP-type Na+/H+ or K+/H+ antiporter
MDGKARWIHKIAGCLGAFSSAILSKYLTDLDLAICILIGASIGATSAYLLKILLHRLVN